MSALRKPERLTVAKYLAIENAALERSEFYDGEMFAMAGAAGPHNDIKDNLVVELGGRLLGGGCRTRSGDQRVRIPTGLYTYPDVVVICSRPEYDPQDTIALTNPKVLIEVLSPSTAHYDRTTKLNHYQQTPSVAEVLLVSHDRMRADVYTRQPDDRWVYTVFDDPAGELELTSLGVRLPLANLYRHTDVPARPPLREHTPGSPLPPPAGPA